MIQAKKRNETLDLMKGFAMLMTIFCHAEQRAMGNACASTVIWQLVNWWHMPLFFIVSGILASRQATKMQWGGIEFLKRKAARLLWPWFVWRWFEWLFMRFDFSGLMPFNNYVHLSFVDNLKDYILQPFRPMWFLFDLFLFFCLLFSVLKVSKGKNTILTIGIIILILSSIGFYYACIEHGYFGYNDWGFLYYDIQYIGLFLYGFLYGIYVMESAEIWKRTALILGTCSVVLLCIEAFGIDRHFGIIVFWTRAIITTSFIGFICHLLRETKVRQINIIKRSLTFMGIYSMEYYTLQFLFLDIGFRIDNTSIRWAVNFASCMVICTLLIVVFKRVPMMDLILWGNKKKLERGKA